MQNTLPKNHYNNSFVAERMAYFCVPADFKKETLERLSALNKKYKDVIVDEVYGNLPKTPYGSGRSSVSIIKVNLKSLKKYIKECNKYGIAFNYTFNANTLSNREFNNADKRKILLYIKKLYNAGVRRFTVSLPSIISLINNNFEDVEVVLSVVNNITSEYQLKEFLEAGKVIRAYVAEEMNRRPRKLKEILSSSKVPIATIVNPFCIFQCAYRQHHYNFMSFRDVNDKIDVIEYYGARCGQIKVNNPDEVIKIPWIRPSDIDKYIDMGVQWFKIAGREMIKAGADIPKAVEIYMSKTYDGDLMDVINNFSNKHYNMIFSLDSKSMDHYFDYIFNKSVDCSRELCGECGMCKKFSKFVKIDKKYLDMLPKYEPLK